MKSGTFASDGNAAPQPQGKHNFSHLARFASDVLLIADKYDALRPNLPQMTAQPTGWGYQGMNGMPGAYGYQR